MSSSLKNNKVRWQGKGPEEDSWFFYSDINELQALEDYLELNPELHRIEQAWAKYEETQAEVGSRRQLKNAIYHGMSKTLLPGLPPFNRSHIQRSVAAKSLSM
jgi:hypothetical protein